MVNKYGLQTSFESPKQRLPRKPKIFSVNRSYASLLPGGYTCFQPHLIQLDQVKRHRRRKPRPAKKQIISLNLRLPPPML